MAIINTPDLNKARKEIQISKKNKEPVIVKAQDEEFNRKILEHPDVNILLSPEIHNRKDSLKQRDSGLNEFLCKLARQNNKAIAVDIESLSKLDKKDKAKVLARIMQNIELCKRTKTKIVLLPENEYNKLEALSFFKVLKGSTEQGKVSIN